jgi:hypothetical protein
LSRIRSLFGQVIRLTGRHPSVLLRTTSWIEILESLQPRETGIPLVRIGTHGDGGYLVPDDLYGIETLISPGAGGNASFELELEAFGIKSIIVDNDIAMKPNPMPLNSIFLEKKLSGFDSQDSISLNTLVELSGSIGDLMLQMDIEGHEYAALNSLNRLNLDRFRIIVIEFHYTFDWIFEHNWKWNYEQIFSKLLANHTVVHIHANNTGGKFEFGGVNFPNLLEVTFLRKDRILELGGKIQMPNSLDKDSDPRRKPMPRKGLGFG